MGTRSRIGIVNSDGSVDSIYCHWDGYTRFNGRRLLQNYTTEDMVRSLITLGNLSTLGLTIGHKQSFDSPTDKTWCLAYGRDRGEIGHKAEHSASVEEFMTLSEEYNYLFYYGRWMVNSSATDDKWVLVEEALAAAQS